MDNLKKEVVVAIIVLVLIVILGVGVFLLNTLFWSDNSSSSSNNNGADKVSTNPVSSLTDEEAIQVLNETFVAYLLLQIGADKLHNPPLSRDTPKINFYIDDDVYKAEVVSKSIKVGRGSFSNQDINIKTKKSEVVKMLRDKNYISISFNEGNSVIELMASQLTLFSKGYLEMYEEVMGESS